MYPLSLLLIVLESIHLATSIPHQTQHVLQNIKNGVLHRYTFNQTVNAETNSRILNTIEEFDLDVWQLTPSYIDIYSSPSSFDQEIDSLFNDLADSSSSTLIPSTAYNHNTHYDLDEPIPSWNLESLQNTTYHNEYHPLHEIDHFMHDLANLHPDRIHIDDLGHSAEGREMYAMRLYRPETELMKKKRKESTGQADKPGFVIIGAQHAREWIATASALYIAHALLSEESEPHSLSGLLNHFDFHIIPSPNPDGYVYTWEHDRFWYKNRMILGPHETCIGLDMNRNWGYKWSSHLQSASSDLKAEHSKPADPCSHWYPGRRPFEAPEVNNVANYVTRTPGLIGFLDLRSYGQMLSSPFSYSCSILPRDAEDQFEAALGAVYNIKKSHGTAFTIGTLCANLYSAPGNILDWMYGTADITYSYAAHLPDTGTYGYSLPSDWIRPVGEQTGTMIQSLTEFITKKLNYSKRHG